MAAFGRPGKRSETKKRIEKQFLILVAQRFSAAISSE
jgi:hypothetical protein